MFLDVLRVGLLSAANVFLFIRSSHPLLFLWIEFAEDVACALLSGLGTQISIPEREAAMGNAMTGKTQQALFSVWHVQDTKKRKLMTRTDNLVDHVCMPFYGFIHSNDSY